MKIPRCMSTQHPDNIHLPFFVESPDFGGEDEIKEAYYAYSHLLCDEQMWDAEGKEVDNYVVKKLITKYPDYFSEHRLGKDIFLTMRVPNPREETAEAKIVVETLESIPRQFDASQLVFEDDVAPIFEVILPMTVSGQGLDRIYNYYHNFVVGQQTLPIAHGEITVKEWIGSFEPLSINVIPLIEDVEHILNADSILKEYLKGKNLEYQRVFFARSDPAMNSGLIATVLANKVSHQKIQHLSEELSIDFYPIIGVGSAPFRGNLNPNSVERVMDEYPSIQTFTIQSAFKYDYPPKLATEGINKIRAAHRKKPQHMEEERCLGIIEKYSKEYDKQVLELAPMINKISNIIPPRRRRKMHTGIFGYCRALGESCLPRAIGFTASLYSIGIPPELLGLNALTQEDYDFVLTQYKYLEKDLSDALKFYNPNQVLMPKKVVERIKELDLDVEKDEEHQELTDYIFDSVKKDLREDLTNKVLSAANRRNFLG